MNNKLYVSLALLFVPAVSFLSFSPSGDDWMKTEIYFGLSKPGGGIVTSDEFKAFTDSVIAPVFFEGFTVTNSSGGWFDSDIGKTIFEDSRIVTRFSKMDEKASSDIDTIRAKYKRYFNQQSVLRVDTKALVYFE
jgi:hypothetical protein